MIVDNLREIDFDGSVCLNLYNEPTAQKAVLLDAIAGIRRAAPKAEILFASNGDYLDPEYVRQLADGGVGTIYVTLHAKKDTPYSDVYSLNRFAEFSQRIGLRPEFDHLVPGATIRATYKFQNLSLVTWTVNLQAAGTNRGGLITSIVPESRRTNPCDRVFSEFTVSYDGSLFPCCQLFTDAPEHDAYRLGHLADYENIFEAYATQQFAEWRRGLLTYGEKRAPCSTCLERETPGTQAGIAEREALYAQLVET